jgi:Protein of unknown function (DUF1592)/Protein of unknown function (DUF1588)/Protein of unknown function (DUF1587)/Protein of unknown function (DUF1585)/Protein of unknown function (DUF1595)/Ca-dependent carbohydrate-binding module xylan-binding/Planctomycete cytochrome C
MKLRRTSFFILVLLTGVAIQAAFRTGKTPAVVAQDVPLVKSDGTRVISDKPTYEKDILPFLKKHCFSCHGDGKAKSGMSFDKFKDNDSVLQDRKTWDNVQHMLETREMPPKERPKPEPVEIDTALKSIRDLFHEFDRTAKPNVGRVTIRRLNRTEYNNTIRDLVGVDFKPAEDFPADDVGYGFDNIGDVLSVSPLLLEKYLSAAELILEQTIVIMDPPKLGKQKIDVMRDKFKNTPKEMGGTAIFEEGDYVIRCQVAADQAGEEPVKAMLAAGGKNVKEFEIKGPSDKATMQEVKIRMKQGTVRVAVSLVNPTTNPAENAPKRAIYVRSIEVEGPFNPPPPPRSEAYKRLMTHKEGLPPREAAREIITRFATRAFRRPALPEEVDASLTLFDASEKKGRRFELCVRVALYRVMISPHFLFRVELDPPNTPPGTPYMIGEYELASRLSYFLWNSMPDDELLALAGKGELRKNLPNQILRMTKDPKSNSFLEGFAEQWLTLRKLELASPDPKLFPKFDNALRDAMVRESQLFFASLVQEDRSILDLLDADFTFVNEPLAKHYGITGVKGKKFVRVKTPPGRGGVLTQASILTLTSNATRTSPVKRGKFVLEQILNTPPPPPPPDVPELDDQHELKGTLRQIMEQHRANPVCASCHHRMDPLGFAFENFDPVGVWRDKDGGAAVDPSGELPDGRTFKGPDGLKQLLKQNNSLFVRCLSEKMLTYALGRGLEPYDRGAVDKIVAGVTKEDYRFAALISEIVKSEPFQMRMTGETK